MTVTAAQPRRAVVDLGADATILDAARRIGEVEAQDLVIVVPAGAPLTRNAVFLDVLRRRAGDRRVVLVSSEARARSLAASVHMRAFSSLAALDRHELDATEHLSDVRRAAMSTIAVRGSRPAVSGGRAAAVVMSLLAAAAILLAVVGPSATIVIAASSSPLGPYEYDLRAGPGGDIRAITLTDEKISAKTAVTPTDSRLEESKAQGVERFRNVTTNDIRIPTGTIVQTTDTPPIRFRTKEDAVLPRSTVIPDFKVSSVMIPIEAVENGPGGNVGAGRIIRGSNADYIVDNPAPTSGGDSKKIPVVQITDYVLAVSRADADLEAAAKKRADDWRKEVVANTVVYGVAWKRTAVSPATDVVGKSGDGPFQITVTGTATAYRVDASEPKATAVNKLKLEVGSGMDVDARAAVVDNVGSPSVESDGVHWRVRASARQFAQVREDQLKAALAGRAFEDLTALADRSGFQVRSITAWPEWWPRFPVLDLRITIQVDSGSATGPP
jgi:hypothetical protein